MAEVVIGQQGDDPAGFALFFHSFSTFLGRPGIYLEDLYVKPEFRGIGIGRAILVYLARLTKERKCGRLEWSVLNWNEPKPVRAQGEQVSPERQATGSVV